MKARSLTLAVLLLAAAATGALAQERHGHGNRHGGGRDARAPQAQAPQATPEARAHHGGGDRGQRWRPQDGGRFGGGGGDRRDMDRNPAPRPDQAARGGERRNWNGDGGQRRDWNRNDSARREWNRNDGGRRDGNRNESARHDGNRNDGGRRDWNRNAGARHDWNRNDGGHRDWNRNYGVRHGWNRHDGGRHGRWAPNRYPHSYRSAQRYRGHSWHAPHGYYSRVWAFGETLPVGWYTPQYQLFDWWAYGLPEPPPGFDWVRVGDDALLIDEFTGRIVQIVRYVFW